VVQIPASHHFAPVEPFGIDQAVQLADQARDHRLDVAVSVTAIALAGEAGERRDRGMGPGNPTVDFTVHRRVCPFSVLPGRQDAIDAADGQK
jgi:hypothetical protein